MKYIAYLALLLVSSFPVYATEQYPDYIEFENETSELEASWEYPSPLQIYFHISNKKYPFTGLSTANYRGHIATWKLDNNELYLTKLVVKDEEIDINSIFPGKTVNDVVKADWFSGIAKINTGKHKKPYKEGYITKYKRRIFLKFKDGTLTNKVILTSEEYSKAIREYFQRKKTDNPVKTGVIFEYAKYIHSFYNDDSTQKKK